MKTTIFRWVILIYFIIWQVQNSINNQRPNPIEVLYWMPSSTAFFRELSTERPSKKCSKRSHGRRPNTSLFSSGMRAANSAPSTVTCPRPTKWWSSMARDLVKSTKSCSISSSSEFRLCTSIHINTNLHIPHRYNSGGKCFSQVHTKHLTVTIDAFTIHNSLWQGKRVQLPSKKDMALVI